MREALAERVAYRCSNPNCRKATVGPDTCDGSVSIGEAAALLNRLP